MSLPDADARGHAVDPARNVVLEASAGTGKTRVLVERYVNLLRAGVDPEHILAITFTRKAAAEMRSRILDRLGEAHRRSEIDRGRWRDLEHRLGDVEISTIDAFCLSLLREFPLEADVDPTFQLADDTEVPRLLDEALDQTLRSCRTIAREDDDVGLVLAHLGERRLRAGLVPLLQRRLVAPQALRRYLEFGPRDLTTTGACGRAAKRLRDLFEGAPGGLASLLDDGPVHRPQFAMLAADIRRMCADVDGLAYGTASGQAAFRVLIDHLREYFLTREGKPRGTRFTGTGFSAADCHSVDAWTGHRRVAAAAAPAVAEAIRAFRRDLNVVLSRGVWRILAIALDAYQRTLDARAPLDFSSVLQRAVQLLSGMDEFAKSRFRLEARYRHVLVDEFQDTNRVQWELVAQLVGSWGEGLGAAADTLPPSIFIVGDRKQSIYGFRDADVALLDEAATFIGRLRAEGEPRRAISVSFRAVPALQAFVNDVFEAVEKSPHRGDAFRYGADDRFPVRAADLTSEAERVVPGGLSLAGDPAVGMVTGPTTGAAADRVAHEIVRLLAGATVHDRGSGERRQAQPADVAILFRSRDSHRDFEKALERRRVSTYVYRGLGFFEAPEIQDALALLKYLAEPLSDLRAAALLRSRIIRLSDVAIASLAPRLAQAILGPSLPPEVAALGQDGQQVIARLREAVPRWLSWVDHLTPVELFGALLRETAYAHEMGGAGGRQARENVKKLRAMVGRFQNRGYATLARVADHLDQLAVGDESNAAIDAKDAVSLMTVHAAKGLEFPIVFLVNVGRGTGGARAAIRVGSDPNGQASVAIADFQSEADEDTRTRGHANGRKPSACSTWP